MLGILWRLLALFGVLLLILLGLALILLLLILFFPVFYRLEGEKHGDVMRLVVRADWLLGCLRIRGGYPEPGRLRAKLLWHTLYDSGQKRAESADEAETKKAENADGAGRDGQGKGRQAGQNDTQQQGQLQEASNQSETDSRKQEESDGEQKTSGQNEKIDRGEYTSIPVYDKMKALGDKVAYYAALLREEETRQLFSHACFRCGKILKNIRPRRIRAELLFGTGEPDTTGYLLALYGIFSPMLGAKVCVSPDFTASVLEGGFFVAGHVTGAVLLFHACRVLFDRRLRSFINKMKAGRS